MPTLTEMMNANREVKAMSQRIERFAQQYERAANMTMQVLIEAGEIRRELEEDPDRLGSDAVTALTAVLGKAESQLKSQIDELRTRDRIALETFLKALTPEKTSAAE